MTGDDKPRTLPVPGMINGMSGERGGTNERTLDSVNRAFERARTRAVEPTIAGDTAEAVERRQLIIEIRTMRRYRLNVAFEGVITGVIFTGGAWALYRVARWILDELRSPPRPPPSPEPQSIQHPPQLTQPMQPMQPPQQPTSRTP